MKYHSQPYTLQDRGSQELSESDSTTFICAEINKISRFVWRRDVTHMGHPTWAMGHPTWTMGHPTWAVGRLAWACGMSHYGPSSHLNFIPLSIFIPVLELYLTG